MAGDDKTEKPTPKHRSEARKRGRVAKSPDLNGAGVLFAGFIAVVSGMFMPNISQDVSMVFSKIASTMTSSAATS